jgi:hypothetical protein
MESIDPIDGITSESRFSAKTHPMRETAEQQQPLDGRGHSYQCHTRSRSHVGSLDRSNVAAASGSQLAVQDPQ